MKKYLLSFIVILLLIVVSISYMGSLSQESNSSFASILVQNQNQIEDTRSNSNILSALFFDEAKRGQWAAIFIFMAKAIESNIERSICDFVVLDCMPMKPVPILDLSMPKAFRSKRPKAGTK